MKLTEIKKIDGKIILKSGLHIGAGDAEMRIGGLENQIIKHPHTLEPFIPGSSIKGKVRAMLELRSGLMPETKGEPISHKDLKKFNGEKKEVATKIVRLFGAGGADQDDSSELGPTRVSFADCELDEDWKNDALDKNYQFTEVKFENSINRITGTAQNPRPTERVPTGTEFKFSVTLKRLDNDDDLLDFLLEGLKLLEMDSLGGSGSRGYGRIKFWFEEQSIREKFEKINPLI